MTNTLLKELSVHTDDLRKNGNLLAAEAFMSYRAINYIRKLEAIIYRHVDPSDCYKEDVATVLEIIERSQT